MAQGLIFFAVPHEAKPFLRRARKAGLPVARRSPSLPSIVAEASVGPHHVVVSGMGQARALAAANAAMESTEAEWVLTCGFAGALDPGLQVGDVLHDADPWFPLGLASRDTGSRPARFACSPRVAVTRHDKARLRDESHADAVEMESGVIRDLCLARATPSATLRVVSDAAGEDLPFDFNALLTPSHDIHAGRMAWAIARAPWKVASLMGFQRRVSFAARRLAEAAVMMIAGTPERSAPTLVAPT